MDRLDLVRAQDLDRAVRVAQRPPRSLADAGRGASRSPPYPLLGHRTSLVRLDRTIPRRLSAEDERLSTPSTHFEGATAAESIPSTTIDDRRGNSDRAGRKVDAVDRTGGSRE